MIGVIGVIGAGTYSTCPSLVKYIRPEASALSTYPVPIQYLATYCTRNPLPLSFDIIRKMLSDSEERGQISVSQ